MWSQYPVTGLTTTFMHFEYVVKFVMLFTPVGTNGGIMTSYSVDFTLYPLRLYLGIFRPFMVFLLEITGTLSTYLWSKMTKNNIFIIMRQIWYSEVSLYVPLVWYQNVPHPFRCNIPYQIPQWKDLQPHFCTESLIVGRHFWPSIHQCHYLNLLYHNHSLIGMAS